MKVVIDTNVLLVSVSNFSSNHWIIKRFYKGEFSICLSQEIVNEYDEVISRIYDFDTTDNFLSLLIGHDNTEIIDPHYKWNLIEVDPDDNKFVDCAIAGNAKFIVSEDNHFRILKTISFPKVEVLTIEEFKKELDSEN